jgi:hypothetical protein
MSHIEWQDLCFICRSPGECSHREPDLRGWRYEASTGKGTAASIKALLKDCVSALDEMSVGARPFGGQ